MKKMMMVSLVSGLMLGTAGCSIHTMTGDVMSEYASDHMLPYLLAYGDTDVAVPRAKRWPRF